MHFNSPFKTLFGELYQSRCSFNDLLKSRLGTLESSYANMEPSFFGPVQGENLVKCRNGGAVDGPIVVIHSAENDWALPRDSHTRVDSPFFVSVFLYFFRVILSWTLSILFIRFYFPFMGLV